MLQSLLITVTERKHTGESVWNLPNLSTTGNWKTLLCSCKIQITSWKLNFIDTNKNIPCLEKHALSNYICNRNIKFHVQ